MENSANKIPPEKLKELITLAAGKLGTTPTQLQDQLQNGSLENILKNLDPSGSQKLGELLKDQSKLSELLSSPVARSFLAKYLK